MAEKTHHIGGWAPGQGCYALAEMVGRGGFATVWRALPVDDRPRKGLFGRIGGIREVAVKVIPVYSVQERSRALREGQIAENLRHENIVKTLEVIPGDLEVYLVTEFVRGEPLDVAARHYTLDEVQDALVQILEALSYAHSQGIIHRDIKPQNALVDGRGKVKLTDFGVAYRAGDTRLTQVGYAVGTPGYIAPEILDGGDPTELTDIYAVGATARALLAHQPEELPPRLLEFVNRVTSPNPAHRPRSASAALKLLTGRRESTGARAGVPTGTPARTPTRTAVPGSSGKKKEISGSGWYASQVLRIVNGLVAGWLGYLGAGLLFNGAETLGIAAGFGVLGYLLPRLAALGVIVALAVALVRSQQAGLGIATLLPAVGGLWVAAGSASGGVSRLPLGPVLAVPLAAYGLGAGLPLLFGTLMRPLGASFSAAAGALSLVVYDLSFGDGLVPYFGLTIGNFPKGLGPLDLLEMCEEVFRAYPALLILAALWAAMAGAISLAEWFGAWAVGLVLAVGGGILGYALEVSVTQEALSQAMTSLGLAAIIYGVVKYLGSRLGR
ncbi:MAG: serine/threonine protein kinase [Actinobacteria bacterium]|nr:serine/threonine protein kinase [Actinomycetota bacterium]